MRETYWNLYTDIKYKSCYYKYFQKFMNAIYWSITVFCSIVSFSSIAAWGIWESYPVLWSVLIGISQVIQAMFSKLPYSDLIHPTKLMISSLDKLLIQIKRDWLEINYLEYPDEKIPKLIEKYELQYSELVSQFFSGAYLPDIGYCMKKAEDECNTYFSLYQHTQ